MAIHVTSASYMCNVLLDEFGIFCFTHCYLTIYRAEFIVRMVQMMYGIVMITTKSNIMAFRYMVESMDFQGKFYGKCSQIKQQPYHSSGFGFKGDKRAGFMSKSVKDRWGYCCGILILDRE